MEATTTIPPVIRPDELETLLRERPGVRLLDVRTPGEHEAMHVLGAYNVPLDALGEHGPEIRARVEEPVILICQSGQRARKAEEALRSAGMPNLHVLDGGVNGWVVTKAAPPETEDFIKFLTSAENLRPQAKQIGFLPTVAAAQDAVTDPLELAAAKQMAAETWHQNYLDQDLGPDVGRVVNDMSVGIVSGQVSPSDAAGQIEDAFQNQ